MGSHFITDALGQPALSALLRTRLCGQFDYVGAGLARDAGASVYQLHRGDAIAGKPAPTQAVFHTSPVPTGRTVLLFSAAGFSQGSAARVRSGR
ncbi:hypothetical protein FEM54_15910 [Pseudomonas edaphica]|uniref:Uncharacterized protein n=1 Tax=Pseudomonas edaphica TaxID=2006980 RepID=A0ABY2U3H4_9PSED|nr:hypothetical protein FEM54_15910 [Pseudomonas edaphica]